MQRRCCAGRGTVLSLMMDIQEEIRQRAQKRRQILVGKDSPFLQELQDLLLHASRKTVILWALALSRETACDLGERYQDPCFLNAADLSRQWAQGKIRMPQAKPAILACHARAKETADPADAAWCHAVGQGCSTVHTPRHAMGYPLYDLTALALRHGIEQCVPVLKERRNTYIRLLAEAEKSLPQHTEWADFLER